MVVVNNIKPRVDGEKLKVAKVVLKRRDRNLAANAERAKAVQKLRKLRKSNPKVIEAVNGDVLLKKRKRGEMDKMNVILAKKKQTLERQIPKNATCLLVARNARKPDLPRVREALAKLGLLANSDCRIVSTTKANLDNIRLCDAYVFYGVPSPADVSNLVHKKAFIAVPKAVRKEDAEAKATPLNNNAVIEDILGEKGLICVEDLTEVLLKGRDNEQLFQTVSKFISSFKVNAEEKVAGRKFKNDRATRGFVPKIQSILKRLV